ELLNAARWDAQQGRDRARLLVDLGLEDRNLRLGVVQERGRLCGVDVRHGSCRGAATRDVEARPLDVRVVPRHGELFLGRANADVVGGYLGQQGDEDVVVIGQRGQQRRIGGLDAPPESAPEIELPGHVEAHEVLVEAALRGYHGDILAGN